jgi:uncharacterized protein (TIGR03435 family)
MKEAVCNNLSMIAATYRPVERTRFLLRMTVGVALAAGAALSQTPSGQVAFEVASVKPAAPTTGHFQYHMTMRTDAGRVDIANASLVDLIRTAYKVRRDQVSGPDWMSTQKFDVAAKLPDGAAPNQVPEMLQTLLATRFKLAMHRAGKELPAFALVAGKGGPKLKESLPDSDDSRAGWTRSMKPDGTMRIDTRKMTMTALAELVAAFLDYPVRDMTEIQGNYDVALDFSPEDLRIGSKSAGVIAVGSPVGAAVGRPGDASPDSSGSSAIYTSLQQLGLKLDRRKLPIELIVIDHLDKTPTEN